MTRTENRALCTAEENDQTKVWQMVTAKYHLSLEETIGSMFTAKVDVFSDSVFCTAPGALVSFSASKNWDRKAEAVMKSDNCKNRNDIAGQSTDIECHRCKYCTGYKNSCWRKGTHLRAFPKGSFFARHHQLGKTESGKQMSGSNV